MTELANDKRPFQFSLRRLLLLPVGVSLVFMIATWFGPWAGIVAAILLALLVMPLGTTVDRLVVVAIVGPLLALMTPTSECAREAARRCQCMNNLKQIALALHNYHDTHGSFPPAYIADEDGKPMHSWRVLILPFFEQQSLYDQYDFNEPWDGPNNSLLHDTILNAYTCPSGAAAGTTMSNYVVLVGPDTVFPEEQSTTLDDIADGQAATILVVETADSDIHWMEPRDLEVQQMPEAVNPGEDQPRGISSSHPGGAQVAWLDGSVQFLSEEMPVRTLRGMLAIAGGETID